MEKLVILFKDGTSMELEGTLEEREKSHVFLEEE